MKKKERKESTRVYGGSRIYRDPAPRAHSGEADPRASLSLPRAGRPGTPRTARARFGWGEKPPNKPAGAYICRRGRYITVITTPPQVDSMWILDVFLKDDLCC